MNHRNVHMRTGSRRNPPSNYLIYRLDSNDPAVMESRYEKRVSQAAAARPGTGRAKTRGVCGNRRYSAPDKRASSNPSLSSRNPAARVCQRFHIGSPAPVCGAGFFWHFGLLAKSEETGAVNSCMNMTSHRMRTEGCDRAEI